jgi:hypothetical protein
VIEFEREDWQHISIEAVDLIRRLLLVDANQRISIESAL